MRLALELSAMTACGVRLLKDPRELQTLCVKRKTCALLEDRISSTTKSSREGVRQIFENIGTMT